MKKQPSLPMAPAADPVDLKGSMQAVDSSQKQKDYGDEVIQAKLKGMPMVSSSGNNVFTVIGGFDNGIRMSIRFWKLPSATLASTVIGLRIRLGDGVGPGFAPFKATIEHFDAINPNGIEFTGGMGYPDPGHRSIEGQMTLQTPAWEIADAIQAMFVEGYPAALYKSIVQNFPGVTLGVNEAEFAELMAMNVVGALSDVVNPKLPSPKNSFFVGVSTKPMLAINSLGFKPQSVVPEKSSPKVKDPGVAPHNEAGL